MMSTVWQYELEATAHMQLLVTCL